MKRVLVATSMVAGAAIAPIATAAPVSATPWSCERYLKDFKYIVGPKAKKACTKGHKKDSVAGWPIYRAQCETELVALRVKGALMPTTHAGWRST
ncbi:hypothetical protein GCM10010349_11500 [Streptomyces flavofungini]|nr:hypothetical protein GCM10010349_11500 [Streptomyces flavofungini]